MRRLKRGGWPYATPPNTGFELNRESPQSRGLVGWWPTLGSRGANVLRDYSGYGSDAVFPGGAADPAWVGDGEQGVVLEYDGGDNISAGNPAVLNISGNITVSTWVNYSVAQSNKPLVARWAGANLSYLLFVLTNQLGFTIRVGGANKGSGTSASTYNDGNWHLVAGIFDGSNVSINVDGGRDVVVGAATAGPIETPVQNVRLGSYSDSSNDFTGRMTDTRIYDRALPPAVIHQMWAPQTRWQLYKPLRRWWAVRAPSAGAWPLFGPPQSTTVFGGQVVR